MPRLLHNQSWPKIDIRKLRKHSVGRWSIFSERRMTNPGQEWTCANRSKHSLGRQSAFLRTENDQSRPRIDMRQSWRTLSRPSAYFVRLEDDQSWLKKDMPLLLHDQSRPRINIRRLRKHSVGRQSTFSDFVET